MVATLFVCSLQYWFNHKGAAACVASVLSPWQLIAIWRNHWQGRHVRALVCKAELARHQAVLGQVVILGHSPVSG